MIYLMYLRIVETGISVDVCFIDSISERGVSSALNAST